MSTTYIEVELSGEEGLISRLKQIDRTMRTDAAEKMVIVGAEKIRDHAILNIHETFSEKQTGGMTNSIIVESQRHKDGAEATAKVQKIYARIQEFGGTIRPRKAKLLHFFVDGKEIFAKKVTLPARPYLKPAIDDNKPEIIKAMADVAETYIRRA